MLLLQGYFAAINASLLVFNRLAALGRVELVISMMEASKGAEVEEAQKV
jgi:hypothetical protein